MESSIAPRALQIAPAPVPSSECSALNERVPGMAVCSLSSAPHSTHQLLCDDTGEVIGEWTDADPAFREAIHPHPDRSTDICVVDDGSVPASWPSRTPDCCSHLILARFRVS